MAQCTIAQWKMFSVILGDEETASSKPSPQVFFFPFPLTLSRTWNETSPDANSLYVFAVFMALIVSILRPSPCVSEWIVLAFVVFG